MPKALHLQPRDLACLTDLGELGLLNTEHAHSRHFPDVSLRRCQQRLAEFASQGLTRTVPLVVWHAGRRGRVPTVHCLTERGAAAVAAVTGVRPRRFSRSDPKPETLLHRLAMIEARLAFDDACRRLGLAQPAWLHEQDRHDESAEDECPSRQRVLYHEFPAREKPVTCQPDAACLVQIPRQPGQLETTPLILFWELDRSTESRKQAASKCVGYAALLERRDYRRYWPAAERAPVRVFWVCRSGQRIESLSAAFREHAVAQQFRFAVAGDLTADTTLTSPIWRTVDGQCREILRLPLPAQISADQERGNPAPHLSPHRGP